MNYEQTTQSDSTSTQNSDAAYQKESPTPSSAAVDNTELGNATDADTYGNYAGGDEEGFEESGAGGEFTSEDFAVPEGMEVDETMMGEFLSIANNGDLKGKDRDQAFVDLYAEAVQQTTDIQHQQWDEVRNDWLSDARSDKEIGGAKFNEKMAIARKGFEGVGTPKLLQFLEDYGLADNPEILRLGYRVGSLVSEDNSGGNNFGRKGSQIPIEHAMYGKDGTGVK